MSTNSWKNRLGEELREYAVVVTYLFICFGAVLFYRSTIVQEFGDSSLHWGLALGKALILGKFLLIGNAAGVGTRGQVRSVLFMIVRRTLLLWLLLIVLTIIEEALVGMAHGLSLSAALAEFEAAQSALELFASTLMMLLILIPYVGVSELASALGQGVLKQTLFSTPGTGNDIARKD